MSAISSALFSTSRCNSSSATSASKQDKKAAASDATNSLGQALTPAQQHQVDQLKTVDADVRRHEAAHLAVAGGYARSGMVLNFSTGPDGKQYAGCGHVDIDASPVKGDPRATIDKLRTVQAAALAPSDPSGEDRSVAAAAAAGVAKAEEELSQRQKAGPHSSPSTQAYGKSSSVAGSPGDQTAVGALVDTFA